MTRAQTKTIASEIFDEVSAILAGGIFTLDEFTRARLERKAHDALQADQLLGYQALALIASLDWNNAAVDEYFGKAMRFESGGSAEENYATCLMSLNRFQEAAVVAEKASALQPTDLASLRSAIEVNWCGGRWQRAMELTETLRHRSPKEDWALYSPRERLMEVTCDLGVPFDTIERLFNALYSFLADKQVRSRACSSAIDTTPGDTAIYVSIKVDGSNEQVQMLDDELTPLLFDAVDELPLGSFFIGLEPVDAEGTRELHVA